MAEVALNARQLACLASPRRNEVFARLRALGEASVSDLANSMGRSPESIHYHVKALVHAGLAKESYRRPAVKKPETVYAPVGKAVRLPRGKQSAEIAALTLKAVAAGFRQSVRGYERAAEAARTDQSLARRLHVIKMNMRLSKADLSLFVERIEDAVRFADEHRKEQGESLVWSSLLFPVVKH